MMNEKDIVPSGLSYRNIRRKVQNILVDSMDELNFISCVADRAESVAAVSAMHDELVIYESNLAESTGDESEYEF